jgi:hypothetical protein
VRAAISESKDLTTDVEQHDVAFGDGHALAAARWHLAQGRDEVACHLG